MTAHQQGPDRIDLHLGILISSDQLHFSYARSGGPGGQNVNKLSTRVTLTVYLDDLAQVLPAAAVRRLMKVAGSRLAVDPLRLVIRAASTRSQKSNREAAIERLRELVEQAMRKPKVRRATKPTAASKRRRLEQKKQRGQLKRSRRDKPGEGE